MIETRKLPESAGKLRQCAEEQFSADEMETNATLTPKETEQLLHELQVHQIEL